MNIANDKNVKLCGLVFNNISNSDFNKFASTCLANEDFKQLFENNLLQREMFSLSENSIKILRAGSNVEKMSTKTKTLYLWDTGYGTLFPASTNSDNVQSFSKRLLFKKYFECLG